MKKSTALDSCQYTKGVCFWHMHIHYSPLKKVAILTYSIDLLTRDSWGQYYYKFTCFVLCREVVVFLEVVSIKTIYRESKYLGPQAVSLVIYTVPISEGPLSEVYIYTVIFALLYNILFASYIPRLLPAFQRCTRKREAW